MSLKNVMTETIKILENRSYRSDNKKIALDEKRFNSKTIIYSSTPITKSNPCKQKTQIFLLDCDSFDAAQWLLTEKKSTQPLVLDFASDSNPGGGCLSNQQGTQEESLCRRSSLFLSLKSSKYPIPQLGCIYVPHVVVFRDTNMMLMNEPFWVSVIASSLRSMSSSDGTLKGKDEDLVSNKISLILNVALIHNHRSVVLGAWGCGAFGNSASEIARIFHKTIHEKYEGMFENIVFAIPKKSNNCHTEFAKIFIDAQLVK
jgi:uncharacterized protein (TIGR02452 family)